MLIFIIFQIEVYLSTFLTNFEYVLSLYLQSQYFEAVKGFHIFCIVVLSIEISLIFYLLVIR